MSDEMKKDQVEELEIEALTDEDLDEVAGGLADDSCTDCCSCSGCSNGKGDSGISAM